MFIEVHPLKRTWYETEAKYIWVKGDKPILINSKAIKKVQTFESRFSEITFEDGSYIYVHESYNLLRAKLVEGIR